MARMFLRAPIVPWERKVVVVRECGCCAGRDSELVGLGFPPPPALRSQDDPAGDLAFTQLIQRLVGMSKRARNHMAAYLPDGSHGEYFPQVLPSTDR